MEKYCKFIHRPACFKAKNVHVHAFLNGLTPNLGLYKKLFLSIPEISSVSVPRVASAATWARACAHGAGLSRTHQHTATSPLKVLRDPEDMARE